MKRLFLALFLLWSPSVFAAPAGCALTPAQVNAKIDSVLPTNNANLISAANVRDVLHTIVCSSLAVTNNLTDIANVTLTFTTGLTIADLSQMPTGTIVGNNSGITGPAQNIAAPWAFIDTTNASNITGGTLNTTRLPSPFTSGTISGNTSSFATTTGTLTNGHCVQIDINGNFSDSGSVCGGGGGGGAPVQIFDTRAAAVGASVNVAIGSLYLNGYSAAGDGGRSQYKRISTPSPVKAWHFQSADGAWWQLAETTVNPKQMGAVCNGSTDDGAALQNISDYLSAIWSGGTFFVTPGLNCAVFSQQITLGANVIMRGTGALTRTAIAAGPLLNSTSNNADIQDVTLVWGAVDGVNNSDAGIFIAGTLNPVIKNVTITGAFYIGIEVFKNVGTQVIGNHVSGHVNRAIYLVADNTGIAPYNTISNNTIDGYRVGTSTRLANYGINVNSSASSGSTGTIVTGNSVRNTKNHGIGIGGLWTDGIISSNVVGNIQDGAGGGVGILVELANGFAPSNWLVTGNTVAGCDGTSIFALTMNTINIVGNDARGGITPIWVYDTTNANVTGNFVNSGSASGITVFATTAGTSNFIQINDNRSNSNSGFGFLTNNNVTNAFLFGNSGVSNVSGLYSLGTSTNVFDAASAVSSSSPNTFTAAQTFTTNGSPIIVNSANSNAAKITLQDAGVTRGLVGATAGSPFIVTDSLGNVSLQNTSSATPANFPQLGAVATTNAVTIGAAGSDTNIDLNLFSKNTGQVKANGSPIISNANAGQLPATATNDNASSGKLGEFISSTIVIGSAVSLTTGTPTNITSISLTAGDWDVQVNARFTGGATTTVNRVIAGVSTTSATFDSSPGRIFNLFQNNQTSFSSVVLDATAGETRVSLAGTTTIYFIGECDFGVSTCSGFGIIRARRMR